MILYHGSNVSIEKVDLNKCKPFKDFGRAFYLSSDLAQAEEVANSRVVFFGGQAVVTRFEFDDSLLMSDLLKIKMFHAYSRDWADFVFKNRDKQNAESQSEWDIVYGPIANDRVGVQIRKFRDLTISMSEFIEALKYMKGITFQYAFCSEESIKYLYRL